MHYQKDISLIFEVVLLVKIIYFFYSVPLVYMNLMINEILFITIWVFLCVIAEGDFCMGCSVEFMFAVCSIGCLS